MAAHVMTREAQTVTLPDGRLLGFAEFGDPQGFPVLSFHGTMSSRLDIYFCDEVARSMGLRVIGVDRPGMGLSTYQKRRKLLAWPADVQALAAHLNLERFSTYGWSAGGQYALAVAATLPDRVCAVALVGSAKPYESIRGLKGLDSTDQMMIALSRFSPPAMSIAIKTLVCNANDDKLYALLQDGMPEPDVEYLQRVGREKAVELMRESVRFGPRGPVADFKVLGKRWGFSLGDVRAPVDLWHGSADTLGPPNEQEDLAAALPDAVLHVVEGAGHISLGPDHISEILETLTARSRK